jgi:hypothetical protein
MYRPWITSPYSSSIHATALVHDGLVQPRQVAGERGEDEDCGACDRSGGDGAGQFQALLHDRARGLEPAAESWRYIGGKPQATKASPALQDEHASPVMMISWETLFFVHTQVGFPLHSHSTWY